MSRQNAPAGTNGSANHEDTRRVKRIAARGAIWVTLTSAVAIPLAYYRNWILGQIGESGEVVGNFAMILLFVQVVNTFVLFGGSSVVTNFLPKIISPREKSRFLCSYASISALFTIALVLLLALSPESISYLLRKPVDDTLFRVFVILGPVIVSSQLIIFSLLGLMEFRVTALLNQAQLLLVSLVGTASLVFFPRYMQDHPVQVLALTVITANLFMAGLGGFRLLRSLPEFTLGFYLPDRFWRFSLAIHANTITTFAYQSVDQFFILAALGTKELGAYFILLQCAQMISFVPQRIGQVMLASFSHLVAAGERIELQRAHRKLCRNILLLSTPIALGMALFSRPIAALFGDWCVERHRYLLFLAVVVHLGSLGSVNSMLVMAKDRATQFLANSVFLIAMQLAVTLSLIQNYGGLAVVAGKAVGTACGQAGLFTIVYRSFEAPRVLPPREYWLAVVSVATAASVAVFFDPVPLLYAMGFYAIILVAFLRLIGFSLREGSGLISRLAPFRGARD